MANWFRGMLTRLRIVEFGRYTDRSRSIMKLANRYAHQQAQSAIAPEHILQAIIAEGGGVGMALLRARQISVAKVKTNLERRQEEPALDRGIKLPLTHRAQALIHRAQEESHAVGDDYVGTQHLLLALVGDGARAGEVLASAGADLAAMREHLIVWRDLWSAFELVRKGEFVQARAKLLVGTSMTPPDPGSSNYAAWFLATCPADAARDGPTAVRISMELCSRTNNAYAPFLDTLAAACAEAGKLDDAVKHQEVAIGLLGKRAESEEYGQRLGAYRQGRAWRDSGGKYPRSDDLPTCWPEV